MSETLISSKRKRAQVSYYEACEDDLTLYDVDNDADEDYSQSKEKSMHKSRRAKKSKTKEPRKKIDTTCFRFLELPAELRNTIYEYCLADYNNVDLVSKTKGYRRIVRRGEIPKLNDGRHGFKLPCWDSSSQAEVGRLRKQLQPALLAVNRQIHDEAVSYLYSQPIHLEDNTALHSFIVGLGSNRSRLRELVVHGWGKTKAHQVMNHPALMALVECPNLEHVFFDAEIEWGSNKDDTMKSLARRLYSTGFVWLESMGYEKSMKVLQIHECNFGSPTRSGVLTRPASEAGPEYNRGIFEQALKKLLDRPQR